MLYITGGDLEDGKATEMQNWIAENEETLEATAPEGWTLKGHYFGVHNFAPVDVVSMWEIDQYAALDTARNHDDETYMNLVGELQEFLLEGSGETYLLREAADTKIIDPE